ncbi:MAG TPA: HigA family addiction module antidote protein [Candidatus Coprousia avicola]|nr:HigA family addiction module antidote protein [Candidatus Coprousia avicola]
MATNFAVAPGEFLQEWIEEEGKGITQSDLAERLGVSRKHVNQILRGKAPISPELALRLEHVTGIPCRAWLAYEALYQEDRARIQEENSLSDHLSCVSSELASFLRKQGASKATLRDRRRVLIDFLDFTGFGSCGAFIEYSSKTMQCPAYAALRESGADIDEALVAAWIAAGEKTEACRKSSNLHFDRQKLLDLLPQIKQRAMVSDSTMVDDISAILETAGVIYQFVEPPKKFPLHGITRWLKNGVPIIQQTGRRKKDAYVIWTLFHELGHLLYDEEAATHIDCDSKSATQQSLEEKRANSFARKMLFGDDLSPYRGITRSHQIEAIAKQHGHVASVVVLELHRRRWLDYGWCNDLITDLDIPFVSPAEHLT